MADQEITAAFGLLSVLLVFVVGYFAAVLPVIEAILGSRPEESMRLQAWKNQVRSYAILVCGLVGLNALVLAALASLSRQVLVEWLTRQPQFTLPRNGLILIDVYVLATAIGGVWLCYRLLREHRN